MEKKKSLGQHFLTSRAVASHIADSAELTSADTVLEVGPGGGILTKELLLRAGEIIAVEKDRRLLPPLQEAFAAELAAGRLKLIENDILETSLETLGLAAGSYAVVANIPYYITGALLRKLLQNPVHPNRMVLLVQKEVAERIVRSKKESLLSLSVKAYGTPKIVKFVKAGSFTPPPAVDSAILLIENISKKNFAAVSESVFFTALHAGFAHKRKFLRSNLAQMFGAEAVREVFSALSLPEKIRAEDVSMPIWLALAERFS